MSKKLMAVIGVLAIAALTAQAVEDGRGTNVVRNLRVNDGGTMELGTVAITNWQDMPVGTGAVSLVDYLAWSNEVHDATNALDGRVHTAETGMVKKVGDTMTGRLTIQSGGLGVLNGGASITGAVDVTDAATIRNKLTVTTGGAEITAGGLSVVAGGAAITGTVDVSGTATIRNKLTVVADGAEITAGGLSVVAGGAAITGTVDVSGTATIRDKLTVTTGGAEITAGGATITAGGLAVSGNITNNSATINTPAGNQTITGNGQEITVANLTFKTIESDSLGAYSAGIVAGTAGQILVLQGSATATNTVKITNNPPAVVLASSLDFTMNTNDVLQLICNSDGVWTEINRVDN